MLKKSKKKKTFEPNSNEISLKVLMLGVKMKNHVKYNILWKFSVEYLDKD